MHNRFAKREGKVSIGVSDPMPMVGMYLESLHPTVSKRERRASKRSLVRGPSPLPGVLNFREIAKSVDSIGRAEYHRSGGALGQLAVEQA